VPIEVWFLVAFVGSCVGFGFAAGYVARRRAWPAWTIGLGATAVALLWPVALFVTFLLTTGPCQPRTPSDPCDGPAMLLISIVMVTPFLFLVSLVLALAGAFFAWWRFRLCHATEQIVGPERG
jgi:hypothetical protein